MSRLHLFQGLFPTLLDRAKFGTSVYLIDFLRLQACDRQADTRVRFPSLGPFFRDFKSSICTCFKASFLHFYTWAEFWTSDCLIELLSLQACDRQEDTRVRFPSLGPFFRDFKCPICTIFKVSFFHLHTWVEFWTSDCLRKLLRLQACNCQADTRVRFPYSRAFFRHFKRSICTFFKVSFLHFHTLVEFWTSDYLIELLGLHACDR